MATVVSLPEILSRFKQLGWDNLSVAEVVEYLGQQNISAAELVIYLTAVLANPTGFNDQTIAGLSGAQATKITNGLKAKNAVIT